jgi:hypothetical protein
VKQACTLDCESLDSAIASISAVLRIPSEQLLEALRAFDINAVPESERAELPYEELLVKHACGFDSSRLPAPDVTLWFHATRVRPDTDFHEGILPLSGRLDAIWALLAELAADWTTPDEWQHFKCNMGGQGAQLYALKVSDKIHYGPFAFVVREIISNPHGTWNHNYLDGPEIIEDICSSYTHCFRHPLYKRFKAATRPCVVKFRSLAPRPDAVRAAMMYVHRSTRGEDLLLSCNTCFDGEDQPIPRSDILNIEWPAIP